MTMTNAEAIRWLQFYIAMMKFDPSTGEEAYLNDDAKKTIEVFEAAIAALTDPVTSPLLTEKWKSQHMISERGKKE